MYHLIDIWHWVGKFNMYVCTFSFNLHSKVESQETVPLSTNKEKKTRKFLLKVAQMFSARTDIRIQQIYFSKFPLGTVGKESPQLS